MTNKTILKQLRVMLGLEKFMVEATTVDGINVKAESLEVGQTLYTIAEDGTELPCVEGSYTIENQIISVDANGVITEIADKEEPAPEEMQFPEELMEILNTIVERLTIAETKIGELEATITSLSASTTTHETEMAKINEKMSAIEKLPGSTKIKTNMSSNVENAIVDRLKTLRENLKK
jgi:uncharacterized coiled-coil protein SlyX